MTREQVRKLDVTKAEIDAGRALSQGDRKLLGLNGVSLYLPGVRDSIAIRQKFGVRVLDGTSDAMRGPEDRQLNENAREYATKYNQEIVSHNP